MRQTKISNTASSHGKHRKNFLSNQFDGLNKPLDFESNTSSKQSNLHRKHLSLEKSVESRTASNDMKHLKVDFRKFQPNILVGQSDEPSQMVSGTHEYYEWSNNKKRQYTKTAALVTRPTGFKLNLDSIGERGSAVRQQVDSQRSRKSDSQMYVDEEIKRI